MTLLLHDYLNLKNSEIKIEVGTVWIHNPNFIKTPSDHFDDDPFRLTLVTDSLIEYSYLMDNYISEIFRSTFESEVKSRIIIPYSE